MGDRQGSPGSSAVLAAVDDSDNFKFKSVLVSVIAMGIMCLATIYFLLYRHFKNKKERYWLREEAEADIL